MYVAFARAITCKYPGLSQSQQVVLWNHFNFTFHVDWVCADISLSPCLLRQGSPARTCCFCCPASVHHACCREVMHDGKENPKSTYGGTCRLAVLLFRLHSCNILPTAIWFTNAAKAFSRVLIKTNWRPVLVAQTSNTLWGRWGWDIVTGPGSLRKLQGWAPLLGVERAPEIKKVNHWTWKSAGSCSG